MNVKPPPFTIIKIVRRDVPPEKRANRTKYKMSCKRGVGASPKYKGFHTLKEAMLLLAAWRKNENLTHDALVTLHDEDQVFALQTDADWALAILRTA